MRKGHILTGAPSVAGLAVLQAALDAAAGNARRVQHGVLGDALPEVRFSPHIAPLRRGKCGRFILVGSTRGRPALHHHVGVSGSRSRPRRTPRQPSRPRRPSWRTPLVSVALEDPTSILAKSIGQIYGVYTPNLQIPRRSPRPTPGRPLRTAAAAAVLACSPQTSLRKPASSRVSPSPVKREPSAGSAFGVQRGAGILSASTHYPCRRRTRGTRPPSPKSVSVPGSGIHNWMLSAPSRPRPGE